MAAYLGSVLSADSSTVALSIPFKKNHILNLCCSSCGKTLSVAPIHMKNGNFFCGRCTSSGERVTIYEEVAKFINFPCSNKPCPARLKWEQVRNHESNCPYKVITCPKPNCLSSYKAKDSYDHFLRYHKELLYEPGLQLKRTLRDIPIEKYHKDKAAYLLIHENEVYLFMVYGTCKSDRDYPDCIGSYSYNFGVFYLYKNDNTKTHYDLTVTITDVENVVTTYSWQKKELREYMSENCLVCLDNFCHKGHVNKSKDFLRNKINHENYGCNYVIKYSVQLLDNEPKSQTTSSYSNLSMLKTTSSYLNLSMLAILGCPICYEDLSTPIYICFNGHSVCSKCRKRIRTCGLCRGLIGHSRNYTLEEILEILEFCCSNANKGCKFVGNLKNINKHISSNCLFN